MSNYRVYIHEIEVFQIDVAAPGKAAARAIALRCHENTFRDPDYCEREVGAVDRLPEDAEVENN